MGNEKPSFITTIFKEQKFWLVVVVILISMFAYGQFTGTRLFTGATVEKWSPGGPGTHNNARGINTFRTIHHK